LAACGLKAVAIRVEHHREPGVFLRLGQGDTFLAIEREPGGVKGPQYRAEAGVRAPGCDLTAVYEGITFDCSAEAREQFIAFTAGRTTHLELKLSDGGWLRLRHNPDSGILVHYRLSRWDLGVAAEGEIAVNGDAAENLCRELGQLLNGEG
jgi:hypothetical protein